MKKTHGLCCIILGAILLIAALSLVLYNKNENEKGGEVANSILNEIKMEIPEKFAEIKEEDISTIVERALKEGNPLYPVPKIMDEKDCEKVVRNLMA